MKKIFLMFAALMFTASIAFAAGDAAKSKSKEKPAKESPCVTDCKKEEKKCLDAAKKAPKAEKKAKVADCEKASKDCKANCDKPKETK
jgi:hypothetical protein